MESCKRNNSTGTLWLLLPLCAAGTALLAFVPSGAWLNGSFTAEQQLSIAALKQTLTLLLLMVVPSLLSRTLWRTSPWMAIVLFLFAFGCGWLTSGNALDAVLTAVFLALPGIGLYGLQRVKLSNFRTVLYGSVVILVALFCLVCFADLLREGDAYRSFRSLVALYGQAAEDAKIAELDVGGLTVADLIREYRLNAESLLIPILLAAAMTASLSNTLLSHLWNRNGGAELPRLSPFSEWRCERRYVIAVAGATIVLMMLSMFGWKTATPLLSVAEIAWRLPCSLAGLCAVRRLSQRAGRGWVFWVVCVLSVILMPAFGMLLTILGMLSSLRPRMNGENGGRI